MCQYFGSHAHLHTHKLWKCSIGKIYILVKVHFFRDKKLSVCWGHAIQVKTVQQIVVFETEVQQSLVSETQEGETLLLSRVLRNGEMWRENKLSKQGACKKALCLKWQTYPNTKINDNTICVMCLSYNSSIICSICVSGHIKEKNVKYVS